MTFNPNSPCVLGPEWFPDREAQVVLARQYLPGFAPSVGVGQTLQANVTEDVDHIGVYLPQILGNQTAGYDIDVYDTTDLPGQTLTNLQFWPGADDYNYQAWGFGSFAPTGAQSGIFQAINNPVQSATVWPNTGQAVDDDFVFNIYGQGYSASFFADGIAGSVDNQLVTKVIVSARVQSYALSADQVSMTVTPYLKIGNQFYFGKSQVKNGGSPGGWLLEAEWLSNPATRSGWRPADIDLFDSANFGASFGWLVRATGSSNILAGVLQGWISVQHAGTDPRVAIGNTVSPTPGWNLIPVTHLDGSGAWNKTSGTQYLVVFRRRAEAHDESSTVSIRYVSSGLSIFDGRPAAITQVGPVNGWVIVNAQHTLDAELLYRIVPTNGVAAWAIPMLLQVAGATSVESQPYALTDGDPGVPLVGTDYTQVYSGQTLAQEFTTPGTLPDPVYGMVRVLVAQASTVEPTSDLEIKIIRTSDSVQMGSTLVITPNDLGTGLIDKTRWKLIEQQLPGVAPALAVATQYELQISSTNALGNNWRVQVLSAQQPSTLGGPPAGVGAGTYGGVTDRLRINNVGQNWLEAAACVATVPQPPDDFTATATAAGVCVEFIRLTWTPTSLSDCGGFMGYELQRSDDAGVTWWPIAGITDESVDHFDDYESLRNTEAKYRIRSRRQDGAISNWSAVLTATATMACCGYMFASNEAGVALWYDDMSDDGTRKTDYPQTATTRQFYGRDYSITYFGLERQGVSFSRTLMVASNAAFDGTAPTATPGQTTFAPLHNLCRPSHGGDLSYVAVHTQYDRWFASVLTPSVLEMLSQGWYTADVQIIEATNVPSTPDAVS